MDSASSSLSILVVEEDLELRPQIVLALRQASCEAILASSSEDAFDLIAVADSDGLYCAIDSPAKSMVGKSAPPSALSGSLRHCIFLRKSFAMDWFIRVFDLAPSPRARQQLA
ncbi:response regulator transcription factor [Microvirga guangxiensis]|uniref:Response regulatory domain-containing protein n=1 Tax=Microvirga guangxiensis TaxID=549386 RepID=A0A1G5J308_9HYPH|nr:response regulator transcription factor [Microvirga guangxiensis]SCY82088.1 hypothetical protein SAMN02927923_02444 [Microvirga guangxiensis]